MKSYLRRSTFARNYVRIVAAPIYFIYKLWIGLVFWLSLLALYPFFRYLLNDKSRYHRAFRLKQRWSRAFQWMLFCPVKVEQRAAWPKPPYIVVSNHSSYLDTVFMYSVVPDYFLFIGKSELLKWPLFGLFFRKQDIPVHRDNSRLAHIALQKAYEAIDRKECIALYPEGTIPANAPRMKAFKRGAFKMAIDQQVPIVAVTWTSNYIVLKDPERLLSLSRPHTVEAVVHPAISTEGLTEADLLALRDRVFSTIDSALPDGFRKHV